ncbi:MAG TPA: hypothetical protein VI759_03945 [Dehalococcoidia bacterium]|nr:hypothetical protein [Dehalococcoidia bacterium]
MSARAFTWLPSRQAAELLSRIPKLPARLILEPAFVAVAAAALSLFAWAAPISVRHGFDVRSHLSLDAIVTLGAWYGLIALAAYVGLRVGKRITWRPAGLDSLSADDFYLALTAVSFLGIFVTYVVAYHDDTTALWRSLTTHNGNVLKNRLYESYYVAIYTWRYAAALSAGVAIFRVFDRRRIGLLDLLNFLLLGAAALISARLLIVVAVMIAVGIAGKVRDLRLAPLFVVLAAAAFFVLLIPFTYGRTAGTYEDDYGITNPVEITLAEISAYVGAPMQVAIGVADQDLTKSGSFGDRLTALRRSLTPTYIRDDTQGSPPYWRDYIDLDGGLTTNSAFAELTGPQGLLAFPFIAAVSFVAALAAGYFLTYRSYVFLAGIAIIYAFAELWRTFLFMQGVISALVFVPIAIAAVALAVRHFGRRKSIYLSVVAAFVLLVGYVGLAQAKIIDAPGSDQSPGGPQPTAVPKSTKVPKPTKTPKPKATPKPNDTQTQ